MVWLHLGTRVDETSVPATADRKELYHSDVARSFHRFVSTDHRGHFVSSFVATPGAVSAARGTVPLHCLLLKEDPLFYLDFMREFEVFEEQYELNENRI